MLPPSMHDLSKHDLKRVPEGSCRNLNFAFYKSTYYERGKMAQVDGRTNPCQVKGSSECRTIPLFHQSIAVQIFWNLDIADKIEMKAV